MYIHFNTSNKSFLKMRTYLQMMGVCNCDFMLTLFNKELEKINPHDDNLTTDQKAMIIEECRINIWYFLREVVRVHNTSNISTTKFEINIGTMSSIYLCTYGIDNYLYGQGNIHKTTSSLCFIIWTYIFKNNDMNFNILIKSNSRHNDNIVKYKIKQLFDLLPEYIKNIVKLEDNDIFNLVSPMQIYFPKTCINENHAINLKNMVTVDTIFNIQYYNNFNIIPHLSSIVTSHQMSTYRNKQYNVRLFNSNIFTNDNDDFIYKLMSMSYIFNHELYDLEYLDLINEVLKSSNNIVFIDYSVIMDFIEKYKQDDVVEVGAFGHKYLPYR